MTHALQVAQPIATAKWNLSRLSYYSIAKGLSQSVYSSRYARLAFKRAAAGCLSTLYRHNLQRCKGLRMAATRANAVVAATRTTFGKGSTLQPPFGTLSRLPSSTGRLERLCRRLPICFSAVPQRVGSAQDTEVASSPEVETAWRWFYAFFKFSRPHTILGTFISVVSVSLLAVVSHLCSTFKSDRLFVA